MRLAVRPALSAVVLAGPAILAFASGGYFDTARQVALIAAWTAAAGAALAAERALPRRPVALAPAAALAGLTGWVAVTTQWAPLRDVAADDLQRDILYLGALVAATAALRPRAAARATEPALAAGILVVIGYGLAGRLLPGVVHLHASASAGARLEQPLTYWNAEGALAALGFVLCARLAGDAERPGWLRSAGAAASVPLALGVYLTFSRGAVVAAAAGLIVLIVLAPAWAQLRALALCAAAGGLAIAVASALPHLRDLSGTPGRREAQGAAALALTVVAMAAAAWWQGRARAAERAEPGGQPRIPLPRHAGLLAGVLVIALVVVPVGLARGKGERVPRAGETAARLTTVGSNRYAYWKVAVRTGLDHPLGGVGSGGYAVEWLQRRTIDEVVRDAHSVELEAFAELGLVGTAALAALLASVFLCARAVHRTDPALAAGPCAALAVWGLHASIDWDWEMPALTLVAVVLAGMLAARADLVESP